MDMWMHTRTTRSVAGTAAMIALTLSAVGCRVDTHKDGDSKNVKIATPFGGMRVETNNADVLNGIGLPAYPGAQLAKKDSGNDDNHSADVNMSFGSFQLRVKAAGFRTDDGSNKVEAFYRAGLKRFGDVIACRGERPLGNPTQTTGGLTCENINDKTKHVHVEETADKGKLELRAGSKAHQHIVEITPDGAGTKFEMLALDLPSQFFSDPSDADQEKQ